MKIRHERWPESPADGNSAMAPVRLDGADPRDNAYEYTYPDGRKVSVPRDCAGEGVLRITDLAQSGHDPLTQVAFTFEMDPQLLSDAEFAALVTESQACSWYASLFGPVWGDPCATCPTQGRLSSCGNEDDCASYFEASFPCTECHLGTQVISIDVKRGLTWTAAQKALAECGIRPSFVYDRPSVPSVDGDHDRYCVVIILDAVCTDLPAIRTVVGAVASLIGGETSAGHPISPTVGDQDVCSDFEPGIPMQSHDGGRSVIYSDFGARMSLEELQLAAGAPQGDDGSHGDQSVQSARRDRPSVNVLDRVEHFALD